MCLNKDIFMKIFLLPNGIKLSNNDYYSGSSWFLCHVGFQSCAGDNVEFRAFSTFITKGRKKLKTPKQG